MSITQHPIPLTVPSAQRARYRTHYAHATRNTGRLFLFAGDQKIEHLHEDFAGAGIPPECGDPEHLFAIASEGKVGLFAAHLGLIARYAERYRTVSYLVKLNGKTNLIATADADPISRMLVTVEQVVQFATQTKLAIRAVGYTVYLGSNHESIMLQEAAQMVVRAHAYGLLTVIWMYPRGTAVKQERDPLLVAGAAGVATCLGADFVKINAPQTTHGTTDSNALRSIVQAAGTTGVICSGGVSRSPESYLRDLADQIQNAGIAGCAVGRNVHQRSRREAVALCHAINALVYERKSVEAATALLR